MNYSDSHFSNRIPIAKNRNIDRKKTRTSEILSLLVKLLRHYFRILHSGTRTLLNQRSAIANCRINSLSNHHIINFSVIFQNYLLHRLFYRKIKIYICRRNTDTMRNLNSTYFYFYYYFGTKTGII
jgi:hypothetical protein